MSPLLGWEAGSGQPVVKVNNFGGACNSPWSYLSAPCCAAMKGARQSPEVLESAAGMWPRALCCLGC